MLGGRWELKHKNTFFRKHSSQVRQVSACIPLPFCLCSELYKQTQRSEPIRAPPTLFAVARFQNLYSHQKRKQLPLKICCIAIMVGSYSPSGDVGGTLHLPSPTHIHHIDPTSAFRQLRNSLSRSPSKGLARTPSLTRTPSKFRLVTSKSTSPSPSSPLSPSPEQPPTRSISTSVLAPPNVLSPSPLTTSNLNSARKIRSASRKLSPMRNMSRSNSIQRSPRKRTLQESTNHGNATPRSSADSSDDQENQIERSVSPMDDPMINIMSKSCAPTEDNGPFAPARATVKFEKGNSWSAKSSPLKRSDGIMNLDQANLGSPSRKRRSLHGGMFSSDFNIFDHEAALAGPELPAPVDTNIEMDRSSLSEHMATLPKRTSSLRKTTLQQRHDKPSFAKSKPNTDLAMDFATPGQAAPKGRYRMSLDSVLPSMQRDSPFSSQGSLPNASAHPISLQGAKQTGLNNVSHPQRHPLSRTISQSTSNSSMAEDSPTHIPIRQPERRAAFVDFSKSLPMGAPRPNSQGDDPSSQASSGTSFATPENYKLAKPLPAAFMSTGLISKRHKNMDDPQTNFGASKSSMPDTPCKRHSLAEIPSPTVPREDTFTKAHHARHSFGTPSTPFNPHTSRIIAPESLDKGVSIFGSSFNNRSIPRSNSFINPDVDDHTKSSPRQVDSQSSGDFEFPPTPTKQMMAPCSTQHTPFGTGLSQKSFISPGFGGAAVAADTDQNEPSCKFIPLRLPPGDADGDYDGSVENSPLAAIGFRSFSMMSRSFTHSRLLRNSKSPTPLSRTSLTAPAFLSRRSKAKRSPLSPASPLHDRAHHLSPHTPRESVMPPDPSGLSISAHANDNLRPIIASTSSPSMFPPATPTAKDSFMLFKSSVTPSHTSTPVEVDPVLISKFDKVDLIGTGEFSQVYKVSRKQELKSSRSYFSISALGRSSPRTPLPDHVWAVKRSRNAYIGPRDRQRKLQEVNTLKSLGPSDHTLQLFNSWEEKGHLYIQTEFCEEGTLDLFLDQVGRKARLDDFRIWKIMLEISLVSICHYLLS